MHYPKMLFAFIALMLVTLLGFWPAAAANGSGVVVEGNPVGTNNIGPLNPLLCNDPNCRRITDFLFPTLYAVDPQTKLLTNAIDGNYGLALDTSAPTTDISIIQLRDDLTWSDGTPVTAYDVFYSYLAINSRFIGTPYVALWTAIKSARVVDEYRIEFAYTSANCSTPAQINFPIVPAHVFDPQFRGAVENIPANADTEKWFASWLQAYPYAHFEVLNNHPFNTEPTVSAGVFRFAERLPGQEIRLKTADGALAFIYRDIQQGMDATQFFRSGQSNVLINPPLEMRDDLLADPELSVTEFPGSTWNYIAMNVANPGLPRSAVDGNGKPLDQGHHPIFGDVRVRQAIQKAIDVDPIIDTALLGYGSPLLSSRISGTWAANNDLQRVTADRDAAESLLAAAGWLDHNADGVRECDGCLYATPGRSLSFELMVASGDERQLASNLLARQLSQIGINVSVNLLDRASILDQVRLQQFDAYMDGQTEDGFTNADQSTLFTSSGDVLYEGSNYGSYTNPEIEKLVNQSLTLQGCDANARAEIDRSIQAILQDDQPYIWLWASKDMMVTRGILGMAPYPNRPFWNIQDWIVAS